MKLFAWLAGIAGAALLIALVIHEGAGEIAAIMAGAGAGLLWVLPVHALALWFDVVAWQILLRSVDPERRAGLGFLYWVAAVREAVNRLLPTANIGGDLVGIRLARTRVANTAGVAASVIFEMLLTLINQYLFVALGAVMFVITVADGARGWAIALGLALALVPLLTLIWVLRHGAPFERIEQLARRVLGAEHRFLARVDGSRLDAAILELYRAPRILAKALVWQLTGYLLGSLETWTALYVLGSPVSPGTALAIEAMTQATRLLLFMVPVGLGLQEAGVTLFAGLAGVPGGAALSLALARRLREILFGVPALLSWQWYEALLLRRAHRAARPGSAPVVVDARQSPGRL